MFLKMVFLSPLSVDVQANTMKCIGEGSFLNAVRCNSGKRRAKAGRVVLILKHFY